MRWLMAIALILALPAKAALTAQETEFFERSVRPVLVSHCYKCHSAASDRIKGGLRLDTKEATLKGGETGPAVVPGRPDSSLLIKAIRYADPDLQMPPNGEKLQERDIAALEQWVRMGAPDPREGSAGAHDYASEREKAENHWAFQPIFPPEPPQVADTNNWVQSPIDQYILAELYEYKLLPSPRADKTTLIRRATFDLTGLPPSLAELDAFLADDSPKAFEKVVDRLLDSPRYGERWGRYWLDLARYADTKGSGGGDPRYIYAYTYRDYVIRAFNEDLPYDQFIKEQIAADKIPNAPKGSLAALGFLTLGNRFDNRQDDIIDDRIGVVGKATMGLSVTCARCHDHKFDPIPAIDYYSWHGIFASSMEPDELPEIDSGDGGRESVAFASELKKKTEELADLKKNSRLQTRKNLISRSGDFLFALAELEHSTNTGNLRNNFLDSRGLNRRMAAGWDKAIKAAREKHDPILAPIAELSKFPTNEFAARAPVIFAKYRGDDKKLNPNVTRLLSPTPTSLKQLAARYQILFADVASRWDSAARNGKEEDKIALSDPAMEEIRQMFVKSASPVDVTDRILDDIVNNDNRIRDRVRNMEREINDLKATHPGAPRRAHALVDRRDPRDSHVYQRGNSGSRGEVAPRRFLKILSSDDRPVFHNGSGRLELAQAIVSEENPLTPRVMVNRIWQGHFGEGIVRTVDDFGLRSQPPTHPKLLDYLAWTFLEDKWSIKKMHRRIMLSSVYQQSSDDNPRFAQIDPESRWHWRFNRRRLDFESLRDTILFIGGRLDTNMGGPSVRLDGIPFPERRSVYGFIDRATVPTMMRAFDFPHPDLSTGKRDITTVPQQALFLMNSPLVIQQAKNLVRRPDFTAARNNEEKVKLLYRVIYNRQPTASEMRLSLEYLEIEPRMPKSQITGETPWEFGVGQFDTSIKRVRNFAPMTTFAENSWRAGMGALSAEGGHASQIPSQAVIRRFNVPGDGRISVSGAIASSGAGDGVQAMIVSSALGMLGTVVSQGGAAQTSLPPFEVKEGDTLDFLVFCRANATGDSFSWNPTIAFAPASGGESETFESMAGFVAGEGGPRFRMDTWQKYAQVLLETNELTYYN